MADHSFDDAFEIVPVAPIDPVDSIETDIGGELLRSDRPNRPAVANLRENPLIRDRQPNAQSTLDHLDRCERGRRVVKTERPIPVRHGPDSLMTAEPPVCLTA